MKENPNQFNQECRAPCINTMKCIKLICSNKRGAVDRDPEDWDPVLVRPRPEVAIQPTSIDVSISNADFRSDEGAGTSELDFIGMMNAGQSYLDLPVPRKLTPGILDTVLESLNQPQVKIKEISDKRHEARSILRYVSPQYLSVMVNTDIGLGTDPERLGQHILNKKRQILDRKMFATCVFYPGLCETVQTVHTITEESQLSNGKKVDFGIAGGFEGVQLGFEVANETSDWTRDRRIIAIADLRYQWATTESRIHRKKLYKFLTEDCKVDLEKINSVEVDAELSHELWRFIKKYGTHVVLKCTHGYRMEKVERENVSSAEKLKTFKAGIMASVLDYAGVNEEYQKHALEAAKRTENSLGIMNIGSKEHMKEAIEGDIHVGINFEKMMRYSSEEGDAGVISHDWNMMISEMLLVEGSPYWIAGKRLQYWTLTYINDLKAGWDEGLFATSYELKFVHEDPWTREYQAIKDKSICVTIGNRTVVHQHPGNGTESYCHITNVHTNEAKSVQISVLDDELVLRRVLAKITVFRRVLRNLCVDEGVEGLVLATEIDTSGVKKPENQWELFDLATAYDWEPKIKKANWEAAGKQQRKHFMKTQEEIPVEQKRLLADVHVVTLGKARAKVCRL